MKKKLILAIASMVIATGTAFSQSGTFTLTDNGLYGGSTSDGTFTSSDTFTLSLYGDINAFTAIGYSFFLQAPTIDGFNTTIQVTSATYFQFTDPSSGYPQTFTNNLGSPSPGNMTTQDIGATALTPAENTTGLGVHLADYTFTLTGAPAGTYTISSTSGSVYTNTNFGDVEATQTSYRITVIPEPTTWSLLGLGGLAAVGVNMLRARRRS